METKGRSRRSQVLGRLRRDFLAGLLVMVPLAATFLLLRWLFVSIDGIAAPVVKVVFGRPVAGIGIAITLVVIYLAGVTATTVLGKRAIQYGESLLKRLPVAREVYGTMQQILQGLGMLRKDGFKQVVLVEFPRPGMKTLGFVTNRVADSSGQEFYSVYIPTVPNPTSGFLEIIPVSEIIPTDITVEQALKMVVSGGIVSPKIIEMGGFDDFLKKSPKTP